MIQEEKAKTYDKALEKAKALYKAAEPMSGCNVLLETVFPELKESEDEKIRKEILKYIKTGTYHKDWVDWLEKQGEQDNNEDSNILQRFSFYSYKDEPNILYLSGLYVNEECRNKGIGTKILEVADKVAKSLNCRTVRLKTKKNSNAERLYRTHGYNSLTTEEKDGIWLENKSEQKVEPKFKVGDWIVNNEYNNIVKVLEINNEQYRLDYYDTIGTINAKLINNNYHLWTIQDAKDGDVLYECNEKKPFIFKELKTKHIGDIASYCDVFNGVFNPNEDNWTTLDIVPATKRQREHLFAKMCEDDYEWDAEKKELKKIEQKPAWSEEDKEVINTIISLLEEFSSKDYFTRKNCISWLKFLRPQNTWKPSDEQIEVLNWCKPLWNEPKTKAVLESLIKDLKKLKKE